MGDMCFVILSFYYLGIGIEFGSNNRVWGGCDAVDNCEKMVISLVRKKIITNQKVRFLSSVED
jgi:hypothetical protein